MPRIKQTRTIKDVDQEIQKLQAEKKALQKQEIADKFEPLFDILTTTSLSSKQIIKLIEEAENAKGSNNRSKKTEGKKTTEKRKLNIKNKNCQLCGKEFTPTSGVQKICSECKAKGLKPVKESVKEVGFSITDEPVVGREDKDS